MFGATQREICAMEENAESGEEDAPPSRQHSYCLRVKKEVMAAIVSEISQRAASVQFSISRRTIRNWMAQAPAIEAYDGSAKRVTMGGQGRIETIPFAMDLIVYMKDQRREEQVNLHAYSYATMI